MSAVAADAGVSLKTLEAAFGSKPALLGAVVDFSIRGDEHALPVARREAVRAMEAAPTAGAMLDLHAEQVRRIAERSAGIAWVVEQAAAGNPDVGGLWHRMTANRLSGVRWATRTLRTKPDLDRDLRPAEIEVAFWLALDWATYRSMTVGRGMSARGFESWLRGYYRRMLLA
jgi:AcrR family transcriptional regulator